MSKKERVTVTLDKDFYMDFCILAYAAGTRPSKVIKGLMMAYVTDQQVMKVTEHELPEHFQASTSS